MIIMIDDLGNGARVRRRLPVASAAAFSWWRRELRRRQRQDCKSHPLRQQNERKQRPAAAAAAAAKMGERATSHDDLSDRRQCKQTKQICCYLIASITLICSIGVTCSPSPASQFGVINSISHKRAGEYGGRSLGPWGPSLQPDQQRAPLFCVRPAAAI